MAALLALGHAFAAPPKPATAAAVHCGGLLSGTTVWRGIDSPHFICEAGVTVDPGKTLVLDASTGPVDIVALGAGGINVVNGTLRTQNTSAAAGVTMRSASAAPGAWAGITVDDQANERVALSNTTIRHAVAGITSQLGAEIVVDDSTIIGPTVSGIRGGLDPGSSITDTTVDDAGGNAIDVRTGCYEATVARNTIRRAGGSGIVFTTVPDAPPCIGGVVRDNTVTASGAGGDAPAPALVVGGIDVAASAISGNTGGGNALDAIAFEGRITTSFTWVTPTNAAAVHPLGFFSAHGIEVDGAGSVFTIPANAVVKTGPARRYDLPGGITVAGGAVLDATAGGATFTSASDASVGLDVCRTTVTDDCTPTPGDTKGLVVGTASLRLANATARYSEYGILGWSVVGVSWVGGSLTDSIDGIGISGGTTNANVDLRDLAVRRIERNGIAVETSQAAIVSGATVEDVGGDGIRVQSFVAAEQTQPFTVANNVVRRAHGQGIRIRGNDPFVTDNLVTDSDTAYDVGGSVEGRVGLGPLGRIRNNRGANNRVNAMHISGWSYNSFTWVEPHAATTPEVVGYLGGNELRVLTGATLTIPENAIVKGYSLVMAGGRLDASAGGATFTGLADNDRGYAVCLAECGPPAIAANGWGSIMFGPDDAGVGRGNGVIRKAQILIPTWVRIASGATSTIGDATHGVVLDEVSIQAASSTGISVEDTPIRLREVDVTTRGEGLSAYNSRIDADGFTVRWANHGIAVSDRTELVLNRAYIRGTGYGGIAATDSSVVVTCSTIIRNGGTGIWSNGAVTVHDSDLFGNAFPAFDMWDLSVGSQSDATGNWWGQATGPRPEQVHGPATTSPYRTDASECSGRLTTPPSPPQQVFASGSYGQATVSWFDPDGDGAGNVSRYVVRIFDGADVVATREVDASARSTSFSGVPTGRSLRAGVVAGNRYGDSPVTMSPEFVSSPPPSPGPALPRSDGPPPPGGTSSTGYWMVGADGNVYAFGGARWLGNAPVAGRTAVDLEPTPSRNGYWVVSDLGEVYTFGDAAYLGGAPALGAGETVTSISGTPSGRGYWLFTTLGRVLPYGDAPFLGDMSHARLNGPVLDSIPTPTGRGYYLVASDGGIFTFGDAAFRGSMGDRKLNAPVQSLVPDSDGDGYWLVASDGGIFAFDAEFYGSMGNVRLNRPVTGMVGFRRGYLMVAEDGGIFTFGDAVFSGSLGDRPPAHPITSVAALA